MNLYGKSSISYALLCGLHFSGPYINNYFGQIQSKTIECVAFFYVEGAKEEDFILKNKFRCVVFENVWKSLVKLRESVW